jgi:hypothetical protein
MRRIPFVFLGVMALLLALALPAAGASPFLDVSQDKGSSAWADAYTCTANSPHHGDETCQFTNASMFVGWSRYNGERFMGSQLCASTGTSVYDSSAETYTDSFKYGCSQTADVVIDKSLASASGYGTVPMEMQVCVYDISADTYECTDPVSAGSALVDLDWTGIPPVYKSTYRQRDQYGDCSSTYYSKGSTSDATVAGTIAGGAVSFDYGQINSGSSHFTFACHG